MNAQNTEYPRTVKHLLSAMNTAYARRFLRYCVSGAATAAIFFGLIYLTVEFQGLSAQLAVIVAASIAIPFNYMLHRQYSFENKRRVSESIGKYVAATIVGFGVNSLLLDFLMDRNIHYLIAQLIASPMLLLTNYFVLWLWVFASKPHDEGGAR